MNLENCKQIKETCCASIAKMQQHLTHLCLYVWTASANVQSDASRSKRRGAAVQLLEW